MPYSITTKDGITVQNIPDHIKPDDQSLKDRVAKARGGQNTLTPVKPPNAVESFGSALVNRSKNNIASIGGKVQNMADNHQRPKMITGGGGFVKALKRIQPDKPPIAPRFLPDFRETSKRLNAEFDPYKNAHPIKATGAGIVADLPYYVAGGASAGVSKAVKPITRLASNIGRNMVADGVVSTALYDGKPEDMGKSIAIDMAGGALGVGLGQLASKSGREAVKNVKPNRWNNLSPEQKRLAMDSVELGVPINKAELKDSTARNLAGTTVSKVFTGSGPAKAFRTAQKEGYENAKNKLISGIGDVKEPASLGSFAQASMDAKRGRIKSIANDLYSKRDEMIMKYKDPIDTTNLDIALEKITDETANLTLGLDKDLRRTLKVLTSKVDEGGSGLRPSELTAIKKQLGDLINANSEKNIAGQTVSMNNTGRMFTILKNAVDKDIADFIKMKGKGRASTLDKRANKLWAHQERLYGSKGAVKNAFRGDPEDFLNKVFGKNSVKEASSLKQALDKNSMGDIQATAMKALFSDSPAKFVTNIEKYNPEVLKAFFEPSQLADLNKIYGVMRHLKTATKEWENPSGTAAIVLNSLAGANILNPKTLLMLGIARPVSKALHQPYAEKLIKTGAKGATDIGERTKLQDLINSVMGNQAENDLTQSSKVNKLLSKVLDRPVGLSVEDVSKKGYSGGMLNKDNVKEFLKLDAKHKSKYHMNETEIENASVLAEKFINEFSQYTKKEPLIAKFGHKISFEPDYQSIKRLGKKDAGIENALHFITQSKENDFKNRFFSKTKADSIGILKDILNHADQHIEKNGDIFYYKKIKTSSKRPYAEVLLRLINNGDGTFEPDIYRFTSLMPDKKKIRTP